MLYQIKEHPSTGKRLLSVFSADVESRPQKRLGYLPMPNISPKKKP